MTAVINPVIWLLAAAVLALLKSRQTTPDAALAVIRRAASPMLLSVVALGAVVNVGARAAVGHLLPTDFVQEIVGARTFADTGRLSYGDITEEVVQWRAAAPPPYVPRVLHRWVAAETARIPSLAGQAHPPFLLLVATPFILVIGAYGAFWLLTGITVILAVVAARVLIIEYGPALSRRERWLVMLLVVAWQPVLATIRLGQVSVIVGALVVIGWQALKRGRPIKAGVALGLATVLKLYPGVLLVWVALRHRVAFSAALLTVAMAAGVVTVMAGSNVWLEYMATAAYIAAVFDSEFNNLALTARLAQIWDGVTAATIARCVSAAILGGAILAVLRRRNNLDQHQLDAEYALFTSLALLMSPITWHHYVFMLLQPLAVTLSLALRSGRVLAVSAWCLMALILSLPDTVVLSLYSKAEGWPLVRALSSQGLALMLLCAVLGRLAVVRPIAPPLCRPIRL